MKLMTNLKRTILTCLGLVTLSLAQAQEPKMIWNMEAENFSVSVAANPAQQSNYPFATKVEVEEGEKCPVSGCGYLENISSNSYVIFEGEKGVNAPEEGTYELHMYYMLAGTTPRGVGVWANYQVRDTMWIHDFTGSWDGTDSEIPSEDPDLPPTIMDGTPKVAKMLIYLEKGLNILNIGGCGNNYTPNFDKFEIYTTDEKIEKPANISSSWHWDYTDEIANMVEHDDNIKKAYDNDDATFARLGKDDYIDFKFDIPFGLSGFLIFTEYGDTLFKYNEKFELQARIDANATWASISIPKKTTARGQAMVYSVDEERAKQQKEFRLQLTASDSVTIREIQLFGYPLLDSVDVAEFPNEPVSYPASLIQAEIQNYRTQNDVAVGLNGDYVIPEGKNGVLNEKNGWFQCASKAIDRKRTTKYVVENTKTLELNFNFTDATVVKSYGIATCAMFKDSAPDKGEVDCSPKSWVLEASDEWGMEGTYDTISVVKDFNYPICNYINMNFPIDEKYWNSDYQFYRLTITNGGGWKSQISEWQLFAEPLPQMGKKEPDTFVPQIETLDGVTVFATRRGVTIRSGRDEELVYRVYDLTGVELTNGRMSGTQEVVLPQGLYVVKVSSEAAGVYSTKAVVR